MVSSKKAAAAAECVKVVVRCRPLNAKEEQAGRQRIVRIDRELGQITIDSVKKDNTKVVKTFTFDQVWDSDSTQKEIYEHTAKSIVQSSIDGYNGTIFAYGQTGTGKSHTMEGKDNPEALRGIIPNSCCHIFDEIARANNTTEFLVRASYIEIYNEEIRDLLSKEPQNRLELKESTDKGVYVKNITTFVVKGVKEILNVIAVGKKNRTVGATLMNQDSSRSHALFMITIESSTHTAPGGAGAGGGGGAASADGGKPASGDKASTIRVGKLNLVDLAGSERQSKTGATGDRLKEATKINLSLSALGNVISALVDGKSGHIPYRDSKLTRMLQDSLGGNTKTLMIANIGPADMNFDETLSTLRYANRAKNIKNKPKINEDPKDAMLREFQEEIARLKAQLSGKGGIAAGGAASQQMGGGGIAQIKEQMRSDMRSSIKKDLTESIVLNAKRELEDKAAKELSDLKQSKAQTEEQKLRVQKQLQEQEAEIEAYALTLEREREEKEALEARLKAMESKVIHGDVNLIEKQEELEQVMTQQQQEYQAQIEQSTEQQKRISELHEMQQAVDEQYANITEELSIKTKKVKRMVALYQEIKQEHLDIQEEVQIEREDLLDDIRALTQQLKLKDLIIGAYVPHEYQDVIMGQAYWNEEEEEWAIHGSEYSGNALRAARENSLFDEVGEALNGTDKTAAFGSNDVMCGTSEKLQNVYFSYRENFSEDASRGIQSVSHKRGEPQAARPPSARRPSSARRNSIATSRPASSSKKKAPDMARQRRGSITMDLRDATNYSESTSGRRQSTQEQFPTARGIVKSTRR